MTFPYIVASATFAVAAGWIARIALRRPHTIPQLVAQLEDAKADRLYPFVEGPDFTSGWDEDALWAAIGGIHGIWKMRRECGILITIARSVKKTDAKCEELAKEMILKAVYLRCLMSWLCLLEEIAKIHLPAVPRIQARSCARLYCDLVATLDTVLSLHSVTGPIGV